MKLSFAPPTRAHRTFRTVSLVIELTLSGVISLGCALVALSISQEQFAANWISLVMPMFVMVCISLVYVGVLAHRFQKHTRLQRSEMKRLSRIHKRLGARE